MAIGYLRHRARLLAGALLASHLEIVVMATIAEGCVDQAPPPRLESAPAKDACNEAADYARRAAEAEPPAKSALEQIANTKSRECAAKTNTSLGPTAPPSTSMQK
jgi:hypothetical protein